MDPGFRFDVDYQTLNELATSNGPKTASLPFNIKEQIFFFRGCKSGNAFWMGTKLGSIMSGMIQKGFVSFYVVTKTVLFSEKPKKSTLSPTPHISSFTTLEIPNLACRCLTHAVMKVEGG